MPKAWRGGPAGVGEQGRCGTGGPGTWESSLSPCREEPEGRRRTKVQARAERIRGSAGANDRMEARYRQAKETKRGEKGSEQS